MPEERVQKKFRNSTSVPQGLRLPSRFREATVVEAGEEISVDDPRDVAALSALPVFEEVF